MTTFLQNFKDSSQEFKNVRSLVTAALLIALHTVLAYFVSFEEVGCMCSVLYSSRVGSVR